MLCGKASKGSPALLSLCSGPRRQNCKDCLGNEQENVSIIRGLPKQLCSPRMISYLH